MKGLDSMRRQPTVPGAQLQPLNPVCMSRRLHVDSDDGADSEGLARQCLQPNLAGLLAGLSDATDQAEEERMPAHVTADAAAD